MEFNRLISLVLGFIVLILVFVWIGSRFRSATRTEGNNQATTTITPTPTGEEENGGGWNPLAFLFDNNETPTPSVSPTVTTTVSGTPTTVPTETAINVTPQNGQNGDTVIVYKNNNTGETTPIGETTKGGIETIPETGAATAVIPLALSALTVGAYLRKRI